MYCKLISYTEDPILTMDGAAANCYATDITNETYIPGKLTNQCINSGHLAITEFATFVFHIEDVSRALLAQITRHRLASFAVRSQRYCSEEGFEYVIPPTVSEKCMKNSYIEMMNKINEFYREMQKNGVPNEDARFVLPNACKTTMEIAMNFRELMHFCNERLCSRAQWEIRALAQLMKDEVAKVEPELAKRLVPKCEINAKYPFCTESKCCGRHPRLRDVYEINIQNTNRCITCGDEIPDGSQICTNCMNKYM